MNLPVGGIEPPVSMEIPTKILCLTEVLLPSTFFSFREFAKKSCFLSVTLAKTHSWFHQGCYYWWIDGWWRIWRNPWRHEGRMPKIWYIIHLLALSCFMFVLLLKRWSFYWVCLIWDYKNRVSDFKRVFAKTHAFEELIKLVIMWKLIISRSW